MIDLIEELLNPPDIIAECSLISNHRHIAIEPQLYRRARLCIGPKDGLYDGGYVDMWDYLSYESALQALVCWDGDGEPDGWNRHFPTKRYRINGCKDLEYIRSDDDEETQIKNAIKVTCGPDRVIMSIEPSSQRPGQIFPEGTKCFVVISESSIGDCQWMDSVFHYLDRSVVVQMNQMHTIKLGNVLQRLKGGDS